jgi:hypothetical protein
LTRTVLFPLWQPTLRSNRCLRLTRTVLFSLWQPTLRSNRCLRLTGTVRICRRKFILDDDFGSHTCCVRVISAMAEFMVRVLHSRMILDRTPDRLKLLHARGRWPSSRVTTTSYCCHCTLHPNTEGSSQSMRKGAGRPCWLGLVPPPLLPRLRAPICIPIEGC